MAAIALALSASLCWGAADFLGGLFSRRLAAVLVVLLVETGGLVAIAAYVVADRPAWPGVTSTLYAALAGCAGTVGLVCFFRAMAIGTIGVVSPIFAAGTAAIPTVVGLATGDRISALAAAGLVLAGAGILLASLGDRASAAHARAGRRAVAFALVGALGAAAFVLATDRAADGSVAWTLLVARAAAVPLLAVGVVALRGDASPPPTRRRDVVAVLAVGVVDLAATACFTDATTRGALAIVAVLSALYPVITVALARLVLHERVRGRQLLGVVSALSGVVLVAAG